jgi:hypothetical protein
MYGRAPVPTPQRPLREPTAELPVVPQPRRATVDGKPKVSWERAGKASRRTLSDGWGFTAFGLLLLICGWGPWAAAGGRGLGHPLLDLGVVLVVGGLLFVILRTAGRYLIEGALKRQRPHARWSHFFTGLYLTAAGTSYLADTSWLSISGDWVSDLLELWPF